MDRSSRFDDLLEAARTGRLTRRNVLARATALGLSATAISTLIAACGGDDDDDDDDDDDGGGGEPDPTATGAEAEPTEADDEEAEPTEADDEEAEPTAADDDGETDEGVRGGTLRIAQIGEPSTLDQHQTTAGITADIGYCMYETLFSYDANYQPVPMVAESYDVSEDGTIHTIALRQGVLFHNGEEMTAEDVIASAERWGRISGVGGNLMDATESIEAGDDYTVVWTTSIPYGTILVALCNNTQACAIYPKSLIDASTDEPIASSDIIGTGPYRLVEHQPDAYIRFERFDDYAAMEGGTDGYAGHKYQYVDTIEFIPVPDEAARVAGMQAGDYHIGINIGNDHYDVLAGDSSLRVEILPPSQWDIFFVNWRAPLMEDLNIRKAFQACLDHLPIMQNSRGGDDFVFLDPSMMMKPTAFYSTAGEDLYNVNNQDLARQYLEDAGYDGTPVRFMCTQEYSYMYGAAIIAQQQMEEVGFVVDLQVTDWATVLERRAQPEEWDIFVTGHGFVPDPTQITHVGQMNVYPGWWSDPEALELAERLASEVDFDTRYEIWERIQEIAYETVPSVKTGDSSTLAVWNAGLGGFTTQLQRGVPYWNVWIES
jgi:peptide/nickel transport system substrate-binding protein